MPRFNLGKKKGSCLVRRHLALESIGQFIPVEEKVCFKRGFTVKSEGECTMFTCNTCGFCSTHAGSMNCHLKDEYVCAHEGAAVPEKQPAWRKPALTLSSEVLDESACWLVCIMGGNYTRLTGTAIPECVLRLSREVSNRKFWFCGHPECHSIYVSRNLYHARRHYERCHMKNSAPNPLKRTFVFSKDGKKSGVQAQVLGTQAVVHAQAQSAALTINQLVLPVGYTGMGLSSAASPIGRGTDGSSCTKRQFVYYGEWNQGSKVLRDYVSGLQTRVDDSTDKIGDICSTSSSGADSQDHAFRWELTPFSSDSASSAQDEQSSEDSCEGPVGFQWYGFW